MVLLPILLEKMVHLMAAGLMVRIRKLLHLISIINIPFLQRKPSGGWEVIVTGIWDPLKKELLKTKDFLAEISAIWGFSIVSTDGSSGRSLPLRR
jgi:hypothetical protein